MDIGIIVDSFKLPIKDGIKKAAELGAKGIQIYATSGEMSPDNLSYSKRKELLNYIKENNLVVSALCGDPGGSGFSVKEDNPSRIELSKKIIDLAIDLESNIVTTHIGVIPNDKKHERYKILSDACEELGEYAKDRNAFFAIETGPEPSYVLKEFLDSLKSKNIKVNFDPANLVMVIGEDPIVAVNNLKDYIVHTHAKDGIMLKQSNTEALYVNHTQPWDGFFLEVPLGQGTVNFETYLEALSSTGYNGFLTIEREVGKDPAVDIKLAVEFLRSKL